MPQALTQLLETIRSAPAGRVDRDQGVIYGVKVLGRTSPNTHDVQGCDGTTYTPEALQEALKLYEGIKVNVDHLPKTGLQYRPSDDRLGKLVNCRISEGEIFGDLHLLKSHPLAERLLEAAEKMPDTFALSHNAMGAGVVRNGKFVISSIPEVRSVDVVAEGGTNKSLFEGRPMPRQTLRQLVASLPVKQRGRYRKLLEAADYADTPMDAEGGGGDWESHLCNMAASIFGDEQLSPDEKKQKLLKALKMLHEEPVTEEETEGTDYEKKRDEAVEEADETQAIPSGGSGMGGSTGPYFDKPKRSQTATSVAGETMAKPTVKESRQRRRPEDPHVRELQERLDRADLKDWIRQRCEAKEVPCEARLLETLLVLRDRDLIDEHLNTLKSFGVKAPKAGRPGSAPRSVSPRPLYESASAKTAAEFATLLLS